MICETCHSSQESNRTKQVSESGANERKRPLAPGIESKGCGRTRCSRRRRKNTQKRVAGAGPPSASTGGQPLWRQPYVVGASSNERCPKAVQHQTSSGGKRLRRTHGRSVLEPRLSSFAASSRAKDQPCRGTKNGRLRRPTHDLIQKSRSDLRGSQSYVNSSGAYVTTLPVLHVSRASIVRKLGVPTRLGENHKS